MNPFIAVVAVAAVAVFAVSSLWLFSHGLISKRTASITLGLALVAASVLYWISGRPT